MVDVVSKGGNYFLNIGPGPDGGWDPIAYSRLKEIGVWIKQNGEAIYRTRMYKVFGEGDNIRYPQTKDGKMEFKFLMQFPDKNIVLKDMELSKKTV